MALSIYKHECPGAEPRAWCFSKAKLPAERMTLCTDHRYRCHSCADRFERYQTPEPAPDPQTPAAREAAQRADEAELPEYACWRCQTLESTSIDGSGRYVCGVCLYIGDREELDAAEPCYRCHQRGGAKVYAPDMGYRHVTCPPTRADEAELQAGLLATLPPMAGGSGDGGGPSHRQAHSFVLTDAYAGLPRYCRVVERIGTWHTLSCGHQTHSPSTLYHPGAPMPCLPCTQAYKARAARGLPPIAGGAPSHYDDPAWYADEAWALQEERNAESARTCDYCGEVCCSSPCRPGGRILQGEGCTCDACGCSLEGLVMQRYHTHPCPTCHQARPCTGTGCADGPRECTTCSNCRGW